MREDRDASSDPGAARERPRSPGAEGGDTPDESRSPSKEGPMDVEEEVSELRQEVSQLAQELLMHRKVLEQWLELRDGCMEILANKDTLMQCLEMKEGIQAVYGATRIIHEVGDRTAELDLCLAGVSDNTARHGKAISALTEQQKRSTATLDAVVRAVKRLDRSRSREPSLAGASRGASRSRGPTSRHPFAPLSAAPRGSGVPDDELRTGGRAPASSSTPREEGAAPSGDVGGGGEAADWLRGQVPLGEGDGLEDLLQDLAAGLPGDGGEGLGPGGAWDWPDWDVAGEAAGEEDEPRLVGGGGGLGTDSLERAMERLRASRQGGSGGGSAARRRSGPSGYHGGAADPSSAGRGGDVGDAEGPLCDPDYEADAAMKGSRPGALRGASGRASASARAGAPAEPNSEMAHCVKGVLARIEEALTKLDRPTGEVGGQGKENYQGGRQPAGGPPRAPESWEGGCRSARAGGGGAGGGGRASVSARSTSRPQSASGRRRGTPNAAMTARAYGGGTQRVRDEPGSMWRPADSWL